MKKLRQIFLVEDNAVYAMMLDYILSVDNGYRFVNFSTGEECLANLYLDPDIIILDYELPGKNGYETLLEIKKHNPWTQVVILTNKKDQKLAEKLLDAGADDFVLKQGRGEVQVMQKIEALLQREEAEKLKYKKENKKTFFEKFFFLVLGIILVTLAANIV